MVLWVERDGRVLLVRRSADEGLLDDLWELPWFEVGKPERLGLRYGRAFTLGRQVGRCRHTITFRRISAVVVEAQCRGTPAGGVWLPIEKISEIATSSLVLKVREIALGRDGLAPVIGSGSRAPR